MADVNDCDARQGLYGRADGGDGCELRVFVVQGDSEAAGIVPAAGAGGCDSSPSLRVDPLYEGECLTAVSFAGADDAWLQAGAMFGLLVVGLLAALLVSQWMRPA